MGFLDALALGARGYDAYQEGKEKRRFQDALLEEKQRDDALNREYKQAQLDVLRRPPVQKPVAKQHMIGADGSVVFYDPMNPELPEGFKAQVPGAAAQRTDPVAVHAANRKFDIANPLPTQEKPTRQEIPTEGERKALFFYRRAEPALKIIDQFDKAETLNTLAASGGLLTNWSQTPQGQLLNQAARQWIQAFLRQDSGAVISKEELEEGFNTYIPRPGDSEAVLKQKRESRRQIVDALREMSGRALPKEQRAGPVGATGPAPTTAATTGNPFADLIPKGRP